jgi:hypothetical protein
MLAQPVVVIPLWKESATLARKNYGSHSMGNYCVISTLFRLKTWLTLAYVRLKSDRGTDVVRRLKHSVESTKEKVFSTLFRDKIHLFFKTKLSFTLCLWTGSGGNFLCGNCGLTIPDRDLHHRTKSKKRILTARFFFGSSTTTVFTALKEYCQ